MSQGEDPEQLIAQALRAHVARTPMPMPTDDRTVAGLGNYGLLSGSEVASPLPAPDPETVQRDPDTATDASVLTSRLPTPPKVPAALVLLLAVLLGLAAGAVVGLLTLI
jgi:hypothetical protein